jgi:putative membrane protein
MFKIIVHIAANAAALLLMPNFIAGITVTGFYAALIAALIWGLISVTVRPILGLLTLPINLITFGLFSFILNALLFWFVASFVQGFGVAGFVAALLGSVVLTLVSWVVDAAL